MKKEDEAELVFSITKNNPKENAISYEIETMQDIFDAVTVDNIDKFLDEFGVILRSVILAKYIAQEKNPESLKNMKFGKVVWTDD